MKQILCLNGNHQFGVCRSEADLSNAEPMGFSLNHSAALEASLIKISAILNERSCGDAMSLKCRHGIMALHAARHLDEMKAMVMMATMGCESLTH
jgi:hypothetical protein